MKHNHIFVRPARQEDGPLFSKWMVDTANNLADPEVLTYPTTSTLCAYNKSGPIVFLPVQNPFMLESLAVNPSATPLEVAQALKALVQSVVTQMHIRGVGETYFVCKDEATSIFAENQCFEKLPYSLYRLKLSSTAKPNGE